MKTKPRNRAFLLVLAILAVSGWALWRAGSLSAHRSAGRKVIYYQDSMHPWVKSDQPGKCTICSMALTPIYQGDEGFGLGDNVVVLSSNNITVLHVQAEEVKRRSLRRTLKVAGTLEANEGKKTIIAAPAAGRIQTLPIEFAGVEIEKGQSLLTLFSPELIQKRSFLRSVGGDQSGVGKGLVQATSGAGPYFGDLLAPFSGLVVERNVYQGQYVVEGEKLFTIVDASVLWFRFDVYEQQLPWFDVGQTIQVKAAAVPGQRFPAVISFIEPTLSEVSRTLKVRAEIMNPLVDTKGHSRRLLRFGMFAEGVVQTEIPNVLAVPRTAILFPGGAAHVYVDKGNGAYERRRVELGRQGDEVWQILRGLEEGERVVTSGNVLIDAQAQFNQGSKPDEPGVAAAEPEEMPASAGEAMSQASVAGNPHEMDAPGGTLKPSQQEALAKFLEVADGISRALAADDLDQLKEHSGLLPDAVASLKKQIGDDPPWHVLLQRIEAVAKWSPPADLAAARKSFLPFSTALVELVQAARGQEASFQSLKVFHCPMAPKPGLWFQAAGPLRNPFYGAEMLTCGEELRLGASPPKLTHTEKPMPMEPASPTGVAEAKADQPPGAGSTGTEKPTTAAGESTPPTDLTLPKSMPAMETDATNSVPRVAPKPRTSNRRESGMAALMSPGAERQMMRRKAILEGRAQDAEFAGPAATNALPEAPMAEPDGNAGTNATQLTPNQQQILRSLIEAVDALGQALAGDNLHGFYHTAAVLPTLFTPLRERFGTNHPWHGRIQKVLSSGLPVARTGDWRSAINLAGARALFLPFSAAMVDLAKTLKKESPAFAGLKIYHSPTAPQPGLWLQATGPLRNPFFGAELPTSGEEVVE